MPIATIFQEIVQDSKEKIKIQYGTVFKKISGRIAIERPQMQHEIRPKFLIEKHRETQCMTKSKRLVRDLKRTLFLLVGFLAMNIETKSVGTVVVQT